MYFRGREPARLVGAPAGHELAQDEGPQRSNLRWHLPLAHHPKPWNDDLLDELFDEFFGKQFRKCRLKFADFLQNFWKLAATLHFSSYSAEFCESQANRKVFSEIQRASQNFRK